MASKAGTLCARVGQNHLLEPVILDIKVAGVPVRILIRRGGNPANIAAALGPDIDACRIDQQRHRRVQGRAAIEDENIAFTG